MSKEYFYDAFISYRHLPEDIRIAEKLQQLLEQLKKKDPATGKKRPLRVFRDQSELPVSEDLSKDIDYALQNSDYLILICSPQLKESRWCMKELKVFRELHGNTNAHIIPLLIEGEPDESFPQAIRYRDVSRMLEDGTSAQEREEIEPLAADVRAADLNGKLKKLRKTEYLRIAAPILGVRFDDLYQRRKRARNRKLLVGCSAAAAVLTAFILFFVNSQGKLSSTKLKALQTEAVRIAELSEAEASDPALSYALAEYAYNLFPDENDVPDKVRQVFTGKALSYLMGLQNDLLQLQFSDSFSTAVEDSMRIYADGRRLALTDGMKTYLYDIATGERTFSCEGNMVYFDPDATVAASSFARDGKNICVLYRTDTGDILETVQNDRRRMASASMDAYWEDGVCYVVDSNDSTRIFRIHISEDWSTRVDEDLTREEKEHILSVASCYCEPSYYLQVFRDGALSAAMVSLGDYSSQFSYEEKAAIVASVQKGYTVTGIEAGRKIGLLKCTMDGADKTVLYAEDSGELLDAVDGSLYYDPISGYCFGLNQATVSVYALNDAFSAVYDDRYYTRVSPDGERFFSLSGDSMDRFNGKGGNIRMLICDMTCPQEDAVVLDTPLYTSSRDQTNLCYCNDQMTRVFYMDPDGYAVLYDLKEKKVLLNSRVMEPEKVQAVSLNEDGSLLALAIETGYREYELDVYSASSNEKLQSISLVGKIGRPHASAIMHVEFRDDLLLVSTEEDSLLLKREDGLYNADTAVYYGSCGNRSVPWPYTISEDGLLFFASQTDYIDMTHSRNLPSIYSLTDGEEVTGFTFSKAFIYAADQKTLIVEEAVSGGVSNGSIATHAGTITLYRYAFGKMEKYGEIVSESADMHLSPAWSIDGSYIVLQNDACSEIYDITTQQCVCRISATGLILSDGRVVNSSLAAPTGENSYPYLTDGKGMQAVVADQMTAQLGKPRVLTDAEKEKFGIKE